MKKLIIQGMIVNPGATPPVTPVGFISNGKVVEIFSSNKNLEKNLFSIYKNSPVIKDAMTEQGDDFDPCRYLAGSVGNQFVWDEFPFTVAKAKEIRDFFKGDDK